MFGVVQPSANLIVACMFLEKRPRRKLDYGVDNPVYIFSEPASATGW